MFSSCPPIWFSVTSPQNRNSSSIELDRMEESRIVVCSSRLGGFVGKGPYCGFFRSSSLVRRYSTTPPPPPAKRSRLLSQSYFSPAGSAKYPFSNVGPPDLVSFKKGEINPERIPRTQRIGHGNFRPRILLTLSHREKGERANVNPREILTRVVELFECQQIIIGEEPQKKGGAHYHVGILNTTATRYNAVKLLRDALPEFGGPSLNVSFHRSWETIWRYVVKGRLVLNCWRRDWWKMRKNLPKNIVMRGYYLEPKNCSKSWLRRIAGRKS